MNTMLTELEAAAKAANFSGAVRVEQRGEVLANFASGYADRANQRPNAVDTKFAVASANKGLTALAIMSLVESGEVSLDTTLHSVVGDDLPLVDHDVTIEHLLTHRSGVGDYVDEEALSSVDDYVLGTRSAHTFVTSRDYLDLLKVRPQRSAPGVTFAYNNSGFVMLGLIIETLAGSFHGAIADRVLTPAGMATAAFLRSDDLPANTALGYLEDGRTNVFHLPVIGAGDGGIYLMIDDAFALWSALFAGRIVSVANAEWMTTVVTDRGDRPSYGRGFWLGNGGDHVWLEGMDAGVSFQSGVIRSSGITYSIMANTSSGAWPLAKVIDQPA